MTRRAIICDLDGTLAIRNDCEPYLFEKARDDDINLAVKLILQLCIKDGIEILLVSSRQEKYRGVTLDWIFWHEVPFTTLRMRPTGDQRRDEIVKKEIYETYIKPEYEILFVLDDRDRVVKMWRDLGLNCWQVNYGNF